MGTGHVSEQVFGDPTPNTGLICPDLIGGEVLGLTTAWHAMFCSYSWETCHLLNRYRGGVDWEVGTEVAWQEDLKGEEGGETTVLI